MKMVLALVILAISSSNLSTAFGSGIKLISEGGTIWEGDLDEKLDKIQFTTAHQKEIEQQIASGMKLFIKFDVPVPFKELILNPVIEPTTPTESIEVTFLKKVTVFTPKKEVILTGFVDAEKNYLLANVTEEQLKTLQNTLESMQFKMLLGNIKTTDGINDYIFEQTTVNTVPHDVVQTSQGVTVYSHRIDFKTVVPKPSKFSTREDDDFGN